jgi:hypothetical protein
MHTVMATNAYLVALERNLDVQAISVVRNQTRVFLVHPTKFRLSEYAVRVPLATFRAQTKLLVCLVLLVRY